ncbi:hypothetical protein H0X06_01440 [Candidatus Dependentiae bacterium]|nr:hypothetical protein [Candidatus Dependentiae bacterium]
MSFSILKKQCVAGLVVLVSCPFLSAMELKCVWSEDIFIDHSVIRQLEDNFQEQKALEQSFKEEQASIEALIKNSSIGVELTDAFLQGKIDSTAAYEYKKLKIAKKIEKLQKKILDELVNV